MKRVINRSVSELYESWRKTAKDSQALCNIVRWHGQPDPVTGKQKRYSKAFRYRREARLFAAQLRTELARGIRRTPIEITISELFEEFKRVRFAMLCWNSRVQYESVGKQLVEFLGVNFRIVDVKQHHAEAFVASRKRLDGKGKLASWTVRRYAICAKAIFDVAVRCEYLQANPFQAPRSRASPLRNNAKASPWHYLTPAEFKRFQAVVPTVKRRLAYTLMYACGLRPGEAWNLTLSNIDLENRCIHIVNRAGTDSIPPFTVKADSQAQTSKERTVPIPESIVPELKEVMRGALKSGGFLFLTPRRFQTVQRYWQLCRAGQPWGQHAWREWSSRELLLSVLRDTKRHAKRAGIELRGRFNLNSFRKAFAQSLASAGVPPRTLAQLLGHANPRVTLEFYNRCTDENARAASQVMDRLLAAEERVPKRKQG